MLILQHPRRQKFRFAVLLPT